MVESIIFEKVNALLKFFQNKTSFFTKNSIILANLDKFIFLFIILTVFSTIFAGSNFIGLCALCVITLTFLQLLLDQKQNLNFKTFEFALLIYLLFCIISTINSTLISQSFYGLSKTLIYIGFYFSFVQYLKYHKNQILFFIILIACLCGTQGIIGILQQKAGVLAGATWQDTSALNPEEIMTRVYGTIKPLNPNLYGGYLLGGLWSSVALFFVNLYKKNYVKTGIWGVLSGIIVFALFCSGCRGAYMGLAAFVLILLFLGYKILNRDFNLTKKFKKIWWSAIAAVSFAVGLVIVSSPALFKRIMSIFVLRGDSSSAFRFNVYHAGIEMFRDNFLLGIGVGNKVFREIYGLYMLSGFDALSAYCIFLEIGIESGIFALISFLIFLMFIFAEGMKILNSKSNIPVKIIIACLLSGITAIMVHGCVDTVYFRPPIQILFWCMITILSVCCISQNDEVVKQNA